MGANKKISMNVIWITWEKQRRSINLARELNADFLQITINANAVYRYTASSIRTFFKIVSNRRSVIIVQNPSIILAFVATILKKILLFKLVIDRHTDPYLLGKGSGIIYKLFSRISNFTLKHADLTIVTNDELSEIVKTKNGKAYILPDPFPEIKKFIQHNTKLVSDNKPSCMVVSSWYYDEPLEEIFKAAERLPNVDFYVTGNPKKSYATIIENRPKNVILTGYVDDYQFYTMMAQCDYVIAITTDDATLVCGAYESIVMNKPFITGQSKALKSYFKDAAIYSDGTADSIIAASEYILDNHDTINTKIKKYHQDTEQAWRVNFNNLKSKLEKL